MQPLLSPGGFLQIRQIQIIFTKNKECSFIVHDTFGSKRISVHAL